MDGELEFDAATVRAVAAALSDSADELALLADHLDATVRHEGGRLAALVREWVARTSADAAQLTATADRYCTRDAASADRLRNVEP